MPKVKVRGGFSDRNRIKKLSETIQLTSFDERTRIKLYNGFSRIYYALYEPFQMSEGYERGFLNYVQSEIFEQIVDLRKAFNADSIIELIKETILEADYDEVLTLIEAAAQYWSEEITERRKTDYSWHNLENSPYDFFNDIFQQEYVGYRFIDGYIVPISDENEIYAISEALHISYTDVKKHILKAQQLLSDRERPDYENSIKESIIAVEALCEYVTGLTSRQASLGKLLNKLEEKNIKVHAALKEAFHKLYGYTSDATGIRHAGDIGGKESTFEEAKFMLVTCCAFVNYIKGVIADNNQSLK